MDQIAPSDEKKLPAPEEKFLRSPNFFEKYGNVRMALILLLLILFVVLCIYFLFLKPGPGSKMSGKQIINAISTNAPSIEQNYQPVISQSQKIQSEYPAIEIVGNQKIYKMPEYQITIPANYESIISNEPNYPGIYFQYKKLENGLYEKNISIYKNYADPVTEDDLCTRKIDGYPDAFCTIINGIKMLDWAPGDKTIGPTTFIYTTVKNGVNYEIQFLGVEKQEKDQILSTFKFTDQFQPTISR